MPRAYSGHAHGRKRKNSAGGLRPTRKGFPDYAHHRAIRARRLAAGNRLYHAATDANVEIAFGSAGFSLWFLVLARTNPRRLKPVLPKPFAHRQIRNKLEFQFWQVSYGAESWFRGLRSSAGWHRHRGQTSLACAEPLPG